MGQVTPSPVSWIAGQAPRVARRARIVAHQTFARFRDRVRRPCPPGDSGPTSSAASAAVSVVVPVYNAMPYLRELLASLEAQDLSPRDFEVIAMDDGSTDGGGKVLNAFAARRPNVRVIHQANSGWPGGPRNVGMDASLAEFVFFADADDRLGAQALRRMVAYARENEVDVLVPKTVGLGGRGVQEYLFRTTENDIDLRSIARSLAPHKLIRRSLLREHGIRFPEGKVRLEDGLVLSRCYLASRRTSVLADYDYYHLRARDDGGNISSARVVPEEYVRSVTEIARVFTDGAPDPETGRLLVLDLYRRKCLRFYEPRGFGRLREPLQRRWVEAHAAFVEELFPADLEEHLGETARQKTRMIRERNVEGMRAYCALETELHPRAEVTASRWAEGGLVVEFLLDGGGYESVELHVRRRRTTQSVARVARERDRGTGRYEAQLETAELRRLGPARADLYIQIHAQGYAGDLVRAHAASGLVPPPSVTGVRPYITADGGFSVDLR